MNAFVSFITKRAGPRSYLGVDWSSAGTRPAVKSAATVTVKQSPATKAVSGSTDSTASRVVSQELSKDAFLQLLVLQMQHQDPLEPVNNEDMLAQLAQFSSLEQMNNLNESFETLCGNIDQLNFMSATNLLGQRVSGIDVSGEPRGGVVQRVQLDGSIVYLTVDGGLMSMAGVLGIEGHDDEPSAVSTAVEQQAAGVTTTE